MFLDVIKTILAEEFFVEEDLVTEDSKLKDDLGIDSLAAMQLVLLLEEKYKVHVKDEEVMGIETVADVIALMEKKTKEESQNV